jgi:hypothetical protein
MEKYKRYLGDGVYVEFDGYHIVLTTGSGVTATNKIYMETEVFQKLVEYEKMLKKAIAEQKNKE